MGIAERQEKTDKDGNKGKAHCKAHVYLNVGYTVSMTLYFVFVTQW